ncbi:hypothetical protein EJB05_38066, partial [Eragrostis curvula]
QGARPQTRVTQWRPGLDHANAERKISGGSHAVARPKVKTEKTVKLEVKDISAEMEMMHKEDVKSVSDEVNGQTMDELDPWNPPYPPCRPIPPDIDLNSYAKLMCEWFDEWMKLLLPREEPRQSFQTVLLSTFITQIYIMQVPHNMQVPHDKVLEKVSLILKDHGFCPTGEGINIGNLCPYKNVLSKNESPNKPDCFNMFDEVVRNRTPRGWELKYARRSFFPYWRSVLSRLPCKVIRLEDMATLKDPENFRNKSAGEGSSLVPDVNLGPLARVQQSISQPKRTFCSAALALLKMLRNA